MVEAATECGDEAEVKKPMVMIGWDTAGKVVGLLVLAVLEGEKHRGHRVNTMEAWRTKV